MALQGAEDLANSGRPDHLQGLLSGKRLLLWREILQEIGYPGVAIIDEVEQGLPLTGWDGSVRSLPASCSRADHVCADGPRHEQGFPLLSAPQAQEETGRGCGAENMVRD